MSELIAATLIGLLLGLFLGMYIADEMRCDDCD